MRTKIFAVLVMVLLLCGSAYALSDAEYTQMMKDPAFARADRQLTKAYREALNTLKNNKAAQEKFRQDQRDWIASGRDEDAEAIMGRYSKTRAYAMATQARAEDLPEIARKYLRESQSSSRRTTTQPKTVKAPELDTDGYPILGMCTGNNVRIRDKPNTKSSKVIGAANDGDLFIVLGIMNVGGDMWYEIDNPDDEGEAWIYAQYIDTDKGDSYGTPAYTMALQIMLTYGRTIKKTKALLGNPLTSDHDKFYSDMTGGDMEEDTLIYDGFTLHYLDGYLNHVDVTKKPFAFGELHIGDSEQKMRNVLGKPSGEGDEGCTYEISEVEALQFEIKDGVITAMEWNQYLD